VHAARDPRQVSRAPLLEQQRQEIDLEEKVAELVEQLFVVAGQSGIGDLIRLFDRVGDDALSRLLAIPRAVPEQLIRQLLQLKETLGGRLPSVRHLSRSWSRASSPSWSSPARSPSGTRPCS